MQVCPFSHDTVIRFEINRFMFLLTCTVSSLPHKGQEIDPFSLGVGCANKSNIVVLVCAVSQLLLHGCSQTLQHQQTCIIC